MTPMGCPPGTVPHRIQPGETFYRLAARYNTSVPAIMSANPFADPNALRVGQVLCVPRQVIYPPCPEGNYYRIRPGETLWRIAATFRVSLDDLLEANPGIDPNRLAVGQVICIPLATPPVACPPGARTYVVRRGDTFASIARRLNLPVQALIRANPGVNPRALLIGQRLCIPV
ncbi:MAG: LysM peptidoglycan-binding domain-containing protein [Bacillota bacterium]